MAIEKKRRAAGVSVTKLLGAAGVDRETWRQARRNPAATRRSTLTRLAAALERCTTPAAGLPETLFRLVLGLLAEEAALDLELVYLMACDFSAEKPQDPTWLAMARLRRIAMYIITVEIEVGNAVLARAIGCSRQNVKQARDVVEGWREDNPKVAVQIARVAGLARRV